MSEITGIEGITSLTSEAPTPPGLQPTSPEADQLDEAQVSSDPEEAEAHLEVDVEDIGPPPGGGFQAFLRHANLHNLLQIESMSRTTGVFEVSSRERRGYLHLSNGELVHAEAAELLGEAAASEILSWGDGEFSSSARPLSPVRTIDCPLQLLLLRLAKASDEASARGDGDVLRSVVPPPLPRIVEDEAPTDPHVAAPKNGAGQRPLPPPRSSRIPPPLPGRAESASVTEVVLRPGGDIAQGRGAGIEEFSARVAYAARLAELIGRAIRSGQPRALELRGKTTSTSVRWQPDGNLSASLELVQQGKRSGQP